MDEISILFAVMCGVHHVNYYIYHFCPNSVLILLNGMQFIIACTFPNYNRVVFFTYGGLCIKLMDHVSYHARVTASVKELIHISVGLFICSVILWVIDYVCIYNLYLHSVWHVMIGITGYYSFKIIALAAQPSPSSDRRHLELA